MQKHYRQGDVLLLKVDKLPNHVKIKKDNIILEGEATGHSHKVQQGTLLESDNRLREIDSFFEEKLLPDSLRDRLTAEPKILWVKAKKQTKIVHEEHRTIELEIGIYIVIRQVEYDESLNRRYVMD